MGPWDSMECLYVPAMYTFLSHTTGFMSLWQHLEGSGGFALYIGCTTHVTTTQWASLTIQQQGRVPS